MPPDLTATMAHAGIKGSRAGSLGLLVWLAGCAGVGRPAPALEADADRVMEAQEAVETETDVEETAPAPNPTTGARLEDPDATIEPADEGIPVHGSLRLRYRGRWTSGEDDQNLYTSLAMDIGDPERQKVTGHFMARLNMDTDGNDGRDIFFNLEDTLGGDVSAMLFYGYADVHRVEPLDTLRIGRQQLWDTPAFLLFDGALIETGTQDVVGVGVYGGLRAQYYDKPDENEVVAGVYGQARPWQGGRVRVDYMYLEDEQRLGENQDDLVGVELWQLVGEALTLEGKYTRLEGDDRDLRLRASYVDPDLDWSLQANYYHLLETQKNLALEVNPYFSSLLEYFPFQQVGLLFSKGFGNVLDLNLGVDSRRLDDSSDVGEFNQEFDHYYVSTIFPDLFVDGLDLTLIGDVWDDDQQDIQTWGLDLTQRFDEKFLGSFGSYYSLYKYDLFLNEEKDDVRTYYARMRYDHSKSLSLDVEFVYEDNPFGDFQMLQVIARWMF